VTNHVGMPGPGGSLGCCAICGKDFTHAVLGLVNSDADDDKDCLPFDIGTEQTLYGHRSCLIDLQNILSTHGERYEDCVPYMMEGPLKRCLQGGDAE
jgi:hypothetical protein